MNKVEELEFLTELQDLSMGVSTHNNIEVYCKDFVADSKESKLEAVVIINVRKTNWKKSGKYIESMFYNYKMRDITEKAIIAGFKEMMRERASEVRRKAREILGIPEEMAKTEQDHNIMGGGENTI